MNSAVSAHMFILNDNVGGRRRQRETVTGDTEVIVEALNSRVPGLMVCHLRFLYMR